MTWIARSIELIVPNLDFAASILLESAFPTEHSHEMIKKIKHITRYAMDCSHLLHYYVALGYPLENQVAVTLAPLRSSDYF